MKQKNLIKKAYIFAKKSHKGQKQVNGKPYFNHPAEVAKILKKWNQDDEIIVAGLLHDVVEDCHISLKEIQRNFGKRVAFLVDSMSFIIINGKKDMNATYKKFCKGIKQEPTLIFIKIADMLSNIPNIHIKSHREFIINKSYPRLMMFWIPLINNLGFNNSGNKIKKEFNKYTNKKIKSVLFDYISKKELKTIKDKLNKTKINEL